MGGKKLVGVAPEAGGKIAGDAIIVSLNEVDAAASHGCGVAINPEAMYTSCGIAHFILDAFHGRASWMLIILVVCRKSRNSSIEFRSLSVELQLWMRILSIAL